MSFCAAEVRLVDGAIRPISNKGGHELLFYVTPLLKGKRSCLFFKSHMNANRLKAIMLLSLVLAMTVVLSARSSFFFQLS